MRKGKLSREGTPPPFIPFLHVRIGAHVISGDIRPRDTFASHILSRLFSELSFPQSITHCIQELWDKNTAVALPVRFVESRIDV
jgi:hypothetical protein